MIESPKDFEAERHEISSDDTEALALAHALDVSDEAVYIYDTDGRCKWVNRSGERLIRKEARQIIGKFIFELFPSQSRFQIKAWRRVIETKEPTSFVFEVSADGEKRRFQTSIYPVMDFGGSVQSVVSIGRPFSEREVLQYENRMRGAELDLIYEISSIVTSSLEIGQVYERFAAEFKKLVDFDRLLIVELDESGETATPTYVFSSGPHAGMPSEPMRLSATGVAWAIDRNQSHVENDLRESREFEIDVQLLERGLRSVMRVPLITRSGVLGIMVLASYQPNAFGDREQALAERVAAQIAPAIENARLYKAAQEYTQELEVVDEIASIVTSNLLIEGLYERFVTEIRRIVDFDRISIIKLKEDGRLANPEYVSSPDPFGLEMRDPWPLENTAVGWSVENRASLVEPDLAESMRFLADNTLLEAGVRSVIRVPLISNERAIGGFSLSHHEPNKFGPRERRILERLAAQIAPAIENARLYHELEQAFETLSETQDQLVRVERLRAMGELASGVAHDLNNALAAILGRAQLLMNQMEDETHVRSLRLIEQAAQDSAQVVKRILDFARLESDQTDFTAVNVEQLLNDVIELTRHRWSDEAQSKGQTIEIRKEMSTVPEVLGSYSELREVLMNIVINAYEAIEGDGAITMSSSVANGAVRITVADSGPGMTEETKEKVFNPFFTTKGSRGTGLGLSIALGIITKHNGTLLMDSEAGRGTKVHITLPFAPRSEGPEEEEPAATKERVKPARVLVIEDELLIRETLYDMLELVDHKVILASNGEEGIRAFKEGEFDVVFTDLGMPGLSGWDVAKAIKKERSDVPIVMVTGWGVGIDEEKLKQHQIDRVLPKPFDIDEVHTLIRDLTTN